MDRVLYTDQRSQPKQDRSSNRLPIMFERRKKDPLKDRRQKMTKGEYRVGITFNPSKNEIVDRIKRVAADLLDLIEEVEEHPAQLDMRFSEIKRLKALAQIEVESAAMWAVKAATKQPIGDNT